MRMVCIMKHLHERHIFVLLPFLFFSFFLFFFSLMRFFLHPTPYMNYCQSPVCIILSWLIPQAAVTGLSWCILEPSMDDASWITVGFPPLLFVTIGAVILYISVPNLSHGTF